MYKFILFALALIFCIGFCKGQECNSAFQSQIDSLNQIQPRPNGKVKPNGRQYVITVKTQAEFDGMNDAITKAITAGGKNIYVKIADGIYQFHQEHVCRRNELTDVSITLVGHNAVITSDKDYCITSGIGSGWQEMVNADNIIQVVDEKNKLCMIPYVNNLSAKGQFLKKVQIPQWFRTKTYTIERIDPNRIYFIAPELAWDNNYGRKGYNVNYDYLYLGKIPRFRLYDALQEPKCKAARFLTMENCAYRSLTIKGLVFRGNSDDNILLHFTSVNAEQININDCTFEYVRGNGVAFFDNTGNVTFTKNIVKNTGGDELFFTNNCLNARVTNNLFENCGQSICNTFCVRCYESEYYIANNTFRDFGYGAIGVGVWHGFEKKYYSGGIIEHNEIYLTPTCFAEAWKHMLMDSGAIYTWTQNDNVIIRYNYIHDYTGAGDNRGVFCDDGANNLKIYRNVILNIPNSYSIDSRMVKDKRDGFMNNANNFMAQNIVDNGVRFQGHADVQRHVVKGMNYVIHKGDEMPLKNKFENLERSEEDVVLTDSSDKLVKKQIKKCTHR